jgi:hypothetical protein
LHRDRNVNTYGRIYLEIANDRLLRRIARFDACRGTAAGTQPRRLFWS